MALIFRHVSLLIVFNISSFEFIKSNCCDLIAKNEWPPIHPASSTELSCLGSMLY